MSICVEKNYYRISFLIQVQRSTLFFFSSHIIVHWTFNSYFISSNEDFFLFFLQIPHPGLAENTSMSHAPNNLLLLLRSTIVFGRHSCASEAGCSSLGPLRNTSTLYSTLHSDPRVVNPNQMDKTWHPHSYPQPVAT